MDFLSGLNKACNKAVVETIDFSLVILCFILCGIKNGDCREYLTLATNALEGVHYFFNSRVKNESSLSLSL